MVNDIKQENTFKQRVFLLCCFLAVGLLLIGLGKVLGAETVLNSFASEVQIITDGTLVSIYNNGNLLNQIELEEGQRYTLQNNDASITTVGALTEEEIRNSQVETEMQMENVFQIAKKDSSVQKLLTNKKYQFIGLSEKTDNENVEKTLFIAIDETVYEITVDMNTETVTLIKEGMSTIVTGG